MTSGRKLRELEGRVEKYGIEVTFTGWSQITVTPFSPEVREALFGKPEPPREVRRLFTI